VNDKLAVNKNKGLRIIKYIVESEFSVSVLSLIISLFVLALMSYIYGANWWDVICALFQGALSGKRSIVFTFMQMAPLILTGLAVYIPYKAGFFNIGGQGQLEIGALAAVFVATNMQGNPVIVIIAASLASMAVGIIAVLIPLFLKVKRGANEVTTTMMMNFTCTNLVYALITSVLKDPKAFYGATRSVPEAYRLAAFPASSGIHIGVWLTVLIAIAAAWLMKNSVIGIQLKAVGFNQEASKAAGINVKGVLIGSVIAGAALAGLAGAIEVMGVTYRVAEGWALTWGFTGISVAFLGANPLGIIPVAFILAILETGARYMQAMTGVPSAMISIMQGIPVIIFVCLSAYSKLKKINSRG
jgi:simple sugar transport system permease protein